MIEISSAVRIDEGEVQLEYVRSSGPGGQNVNKVATAAQLRFDVRNSPSLAPEVKARLEKLAGSRMTMDGVLVIEAKRYRTQEQNREDAVARLVTLIQKALERPVIRKATRPSLSSKIARVDSKKKRSEIKKSRRIVSSRDE
jgi:ribosome-associated protein